MNGTGASLLRTVVEGRNGRLFLGDQGGFSTHRFLGERPFGSGQLERWRRTIARRARELHARGIPYLFFIVPDAHTVYGEDLPASLSPRSARSPGSRFVEAMDGIDGVTFVDPREELSHARGLMSVYNETDSHWSSYGAFIGYSVLARALSARVPIATLTSNDVSFSYRRTFGDLGVWVSPERSELTPVAKLSRDAGTVVASNGGYKQNGFFETNAPAAPATRLLVFRDSFFSAQVDFVSSSVRHMLCAGSTSTISLEEVDAWKPDIVVTQIGERRLLGAYESDHRRERFSDLFRADFSSKRGRLVAKAAIALEGRDVLEARRAIEALDTRAAPSYDPDHAYVAANVYLAANDVARARTTLAIALDARPDRASFLSLSATLEFQRGETHAALDLAERVLAGAPHNGANHQAYVAMLINTGETARARRHLETTLAHIDDCGVLWYLYSLVLETLDERPAAGDALAEALLLSPLDATFKARAVALWSA